MSAAPARTATDSRAVALALFLAAGALAKIPIASGVTVGDLIFAAGAVVAGLWVLRHRTLPRTAWNAVAMAFVVWALAGALLVPIASSLEFSDVEFVKSFLRLSALVAGALLLVLMLQGASARRVGHLVLMALTVNAVLAIGLYAAVAMNRTFFAGLPLLGEAVFSTQSGGVVRSQGIFSEPAHLGLYQGLGLGYLAFVSRDLIAWFDWRKAIVVVSVALTLSVGAYFLLVVVFGGAFLSSEAARAKREKVGRVAIIFAVSVVAIATIVGFQLGVHDAVLERVGRVATAQDFSATARVVGSWDVAREVTAHSPVAGSGIGNLGVASEGLGYSFEATGRTLEGVPSWNVFAVVLGSMGIVGLGLYIMLVLDVARRNLGAGITIGAAGFITGGVLVVTLWVFFGLYAARYRRLEPVAGRGSELEQSAHQPVARS